MAINAIDAVWIAAATLTKKAIAKKVSKFDLQDVCFEASTILDLAKKITKEDIDMSTVLQLATAKVQNSQANYLVDEKGLRRVSYMGEFDGVKECPSTDVINESRKYEEIQKLADTSEMFEFMNRGYTEKLRKGFSMKGKRTVVTEWIIPANPTKYDIVNAFKELKKIDWKQSTNVAVGDIIYIYITEGYQAIKYKCKVNKVDLPNIEIEDSKFDISGEFNGKYGRYMEIELIKELKGTLYTREAMLNHGFKSPQSPVRVIPQLKEYLDVVQKLQDKNELNPDKHDGSYEIVRETINAYARMEDLNKLDYKDLNLVYLMSVGTWKQKIPAKKKTIEDSNLSQVEKDRLIEILDRIWARAEKNGYENQEQGKTSIGMFGTGFYTFYKKTDEVSPRNFIQMCIDIRNMTDENEILDRCSRTLNGSFHGMKAASASMILHCLKPTVFPIFNSNMGADNIFVYFGAKMKWKTEIYEYIKNVKIVKKLRDENFTVKNYRIFDMAAWEIEKYSIEEIESTNTDDESEGEVEEMYRDEFAKNAILYGPPGTGKTYNTAIYAVAICDGKSLDEVGNMPYEKVLNRYNELKDKENRVTFTTFHQSYGYEEFIEGIKPKIDNESNDVEYMIKDGVFKEFCGRAMNDDKPYIFIIDEINRGNISKIFGELITLIESTKRKDAKEAMEVILPYSNESFGVPNNVYIIGTMNTADRSIALMDTALRRRFQFVEMMPDIGVLRKIGADKIKEAIIELDVAYMLECINNRIEYLYDREHTIGHAFFTSLKDKPTVDNLANIFKKSVIPLLQEYFYEDYSKIMLVLGDNGKEKDEDKFILETEVKANTVFRGDTSDLDIPDYSYQIQDEAFYNIMSYVEITD